jgi:hypothetical protein
MRRRHFGIALVALVATAAIPTLVVAATKAYTSPTLRATHAGARTTLTATVAPADDGTARVLIYAPTGTAMVTTAAPGTTVGAVQANIAAHSLGGALIPLAGEIKVAPAGAVTPAQATACAGTPTPTVIWLMQLQAAGQTLNVPIYLVPTSGAEAALGAAKIVACFTAHDLPGTPPPCAPVLCAQFLGATLAFNGVFTPPAAGVWVSIWTPYAPRTGQVNAAGSVASPAATAPGALVITARRRGARVTVSGTVSQGGQAVAGASVRLVRGRTAGRLGSFRTVRTNAQGRFSVTAPAAAGRFFRGSTVVAARASAAVCATFGSALPVPCVNGTISGFTATSRTVRAR